jgi:hypothetical protein
MRSMAHSVCELRESICGCEVGCCIHVRSSYLDEIRVRQHEGMEVMLVQVMLVQVLKDERQDLSRHSCQTRGWDHC